MAQSFIGGVAAWLGFTLPSAVGLWAFASGVGALGDLHQATWLHGLKIVAVAVVAQALWGMAWTLCPDRPRMSLAVATALEVLLVPSVTGQIGAVLVGGVAGLWLLPRPPPREAGPALPHMPGALALSSLALFTALLLLLPVMAAITGDRTWGLIDRFYRAGALVFGGGHVVLPLLQAEVVRSGWIDGDVFLAGYGAAQAVPGPLFTFAAYLGTAMTAPPHGWLGGLICLAAIFLPSFLLVVGILPFWDRLRRQMWAQAALQGVNAAVVGVLLAAFYTPVWTGAILSPLDFGLALVAFLLLVLWRLPPWLVVMMGALAASIPRIVVVG